MSLTRPTLLVAALVSSALFSLFLGDSTDAYHQNIYQTKMTPPTHGDGASSYNSCGWHSGPCYNNVNGPAQDWGYWNGSADYNVRFRGWLYRSSTSLSNAYLRLNVFQQSSGPSVCNEAVADVIEVIPWRVRYGMHHIHTNITVSGLVYVNVSGSGIGAWNSPIVASMVNDGGCPWGGYHTHQWAVPVALSYYAPNTGRYPCCNYGGGYFQNNIETNTTHTTQFLQGH